MSADNFIIIYRDPDGMYRGFMGFASDELTPEQVRESAVHAEFEASTLGEAVSLANDVGTEYGVRFAPGATEPPAAGARDDAGERLVKLAECPPGLFWFGDFLGFKSEYGELEAFCGDSGEYFWGGAKDNAARAMLMVRPTDPSELVPKSDYDALAARLADAEAKLAAAQSPPAADAEVETRLALIEHRTRNHGCAWKDDANWLVATVRALAAESRTAKAESAEIERDRDIMEKGFDAADGAGLKLMEALGRRIVGAVSHDGVDFLPSAVDAIIAERATAKAESAALREALEVVATAIQRDRGRNAAWLAGQAVHVHAIEAALGSTAGRDILERLSRAEAVVAMVRNAVAAMEAGFAARDHGWMVYGRFTDQIVAALASALPAGEPRRGEEASEVNRE